MTTRIIPIDLERAYTFDEFEALPDDGNRYELVKGKLTMTPAAGDEHGRITDTIYRKLVLLDPQQKLGKVWVTTGFRLDQNTVLEPDLAFVAANRVPPRSKGAVPVVPDLVIEVWSPSQLASKTVREQISLKINLYREAGVKIIWSINPKDRTVEVFQPGQPQPLVLAGTGSLDGGELLPGFSLTLRELFD